MLRGLKITLLFAVLLSCLPGHFAYSKQPLNFVMGPLGLVTDWDAFEKQLTSAKKMGISAITTDIWWGIVEQRENDFHWEYYRKYAELVKKVGLKWVPIMSTHSVPEFAWHKGPDMYFKGSNGKLSKESLSLWAPETYVLYQKFMKSFSDNFAEYNSIITKIYIGMGPSGELRYPSYGADGWIYPEIGQLQASSDSAKASFQQFLQDKYKTIESLNAAWQTVFNTFSELGPPTDGDNFFQDGIRTAYGRDFLTWYQKSLIDHFRRTISTARAAFGSSFKAPLGVKEAGVHWLMASGQFPHAAEYAAGYYNYDELYKAFADAQVDVTFTCFELSNRKSGPAFSLAEDLLRQMGDLATRYGVNLSGENALPLDFSNSVEIENGFRNIGNAFRTINLSAFTFLRLENLVNDDGTLKPEAVLYTKFISDHPEFRDEINLEPTNLLDQCTNALRGLFREKGFLVRSAAESI